MARSIWLERKRTMREDFDASCIETLNHRRALTVKLSQLPDPSNNPTGASDQPTSPLFSELSTELRLLIYREVLCAYECLHIQSTWDPPERRMTRTELTYWYANRCKPDEPVQLACTPCTQPRCRTGVACKPVIASGIEKISLSLLVSCRAIYREAIALLYTDNTFSFATMSCVLLFSQSVLPHRLNSIRTLSLNFEYTKWFAQFEEWERMWSIIVGIPKLRNLHLYLRLDVQDKKEDELRVKTLLSPLKEVRCSGEFVLRLEPRGLDNLPEKRGSFVVREFGKLGEIPYDSNWSYFESKQSQLEGAR